MTRFLRIFCIAPTCFFRGLIVVVKLGRRGGIGKSFFDSEHYCCQKIPERVAAVHMVNLSATTSQEAAQEMDATFREAENLKRAAGISPRGRKGRMPVQNWSLSWPPYENPTHAEMIAEAKKSIEAAGYKDHQALLVIHNDEPQPHIHITVNRVHPKTGVMVKPSYIKLKLSRRAEEYEREKGKIRCRQRVINNRRRAVGQFVKYTPPAIAQAWKRSSNGRGFAVALKRSGHILARGNRSRFVVVNPHGEVQNPRHEIDGVRLADIRARLADIDSATLPSVEEARAQAAQWKKQREAKAERRKARQQQYRRNWQQRRHRPSRAKPVPASQALAKPRPTATTPQPRCDDPAGIFHAPVRASTAWHCRTGQDSPAQCSPPSPPPVPMPSHRQPIPPPPF